MSERIHPSRFAARLAENGSQIQPSSPPGAGSAIGRLASAPLTGIGSRIELPCHKMSHDEMVRDGAARYAEHLRALREDRVRPVAGAIVETIEKALRLGASLDVTDVTDVTDVPFTFHDLAALTPEEKVMLYNPFLPGYGSPDARLVIVGTEHAFDFLQPRPRGPSPDACFAMADCALHALWLADGSETTDALAEHVSGQAPHGAETFPGHRHPYEFLYPIPAGHMWRRLSHMIRAAGVHLERGAAPMWGDVAYMFELSDTAAGQQGDGALPSTARQQFLPSIIASLESARVLVFHGRWNDAAWNEIREPIAHSFLGGADEPMTKPRWVHASSGDYRSANSVDGSKLVVFMQSPTRRGPTNSFLDAVGDLIGPYCVEVQDRGVASESEQTSESSQPLGVAITRR